MLVVQLKVIRKVICHFKLYLDQKLLWKCCTALNFFTLCRKKVNSYFITPAELPAKLKYYYNNPICTKFTFHISMTLLLASLKNSVLHLFTCGVGVGCQLCWGWHWCITGTYTVNFNGVCALVNPSLSIWMQQACSELQHASIFIWYGLFWGSWRLEKMFSAYTWQLRLSAGLIQRQAAAVSAVSTTGLLTGQL